MMSAAAIMIFIWRSVRECGFRQLEVNTPASVGSNRQANAFRTKRPGNRRETHIGGPDLMTGQGTMATATTLKSVECIMRRSRMTATD
jgi:hypothetical protein